MTEITTIKVVKPVAEWLNSLKGLLEYNLSVKLTLSEALGIILGEVDYQFAIRQGIIEKTTEKEKIDFVNLRINQFWDSNDKNKPCFEIALPKEWYKRRKMKQKTEEKKT
jgi:hypothetical protein